MVAMNRAGKARFRMQEFHCLQRVDVPPYFSSSLVWSGRGSQPRIRTRPTSNSLLILVSMSYHRVTD